MRIIVLLKQVPDTWGTRRLDLRTGLLDRTDPEPIMDEIGGSALEMALQVKDRQEAEIVLLTMGPENAKQMLRKALAMGADAAIHVVDEQLAGADLLWTAKTLAAGVRRLGFDLIVAGNVSTDGRAGVVPAMIAEHLDVPHLTFLHTVDIDERLVRGERRDESGTVTLSAQLPAVVSIAESTFEPRFPSFRDVMRAKKKPIDILSLDDLQVAAPAGRSVVTSVKERSLERGGKKIVDDGTAGAQIVELLKSRGLIRGE